MSIRSKIILSLLSISTLVILLAGVNVFTTQKAKQSFTNVDQTTFPTINLLNHIKTTGFQVQQEILSLLIQNNAQTQGEMSSMAELEVACDSFKSSLGTLEAFFASSNIGYTQQLQTILDEYGQIAGEITSGIDNETTLLLQTRLQANELKFISVIDSALSESIESYEASQKASFSYLKLALSIGIGAIFAALLLSLVLGQLLSKLILKPLNSLTDAAKYFGKTAQDIPVSSRNNLEKISKQSDEIGLLASTFLEMNQRVGTLNTKLGYEASYDALTDIPNRISFHRALTSAVHKFKKTQQPFTVLFIDFNGFKNINDSYGHRTGDELLKAFAIRLKGVAREQDVLARLGGDEFTVLLNKTSLTQAKVIAERIHQACAKPFIAGEQTIVMTVSIGLTEMETQCQDADSILRDADLAMYSAKSKGQGFSESFSPCMHSTAVKRLELEQDLRNAISNQELVVYYQPIHDANTMLLTGLEALVRWNHPKKGLVPPMDFLPLAEETGLIQDIDIWVLETACQQMLNWQTLYRQPLSLSVNFSGIHFRDKHLSERLLEQLARLKFNPSHLNIELTEGSLIESIDVVMDTLEALRSKGIRIHLDDFGTGYSSLSYINRFPIDVLKIDKSFIQKIYSSQEDLAIVRAIIAMANSLNIGTVAEGVELTNQAELLSSEGCTRLQGYFFAKPLGIEDASQYLADLEANSLPPVVEVHVPVSNQVAN